MTHRKDRSDRLALPHLDGTQDRVIPTLILILLWSVTMFLVIARIRFDVARGGGPWQTADWLVNYGSGVVRRGGIGEAILWLSDLLSINALSFVYTLQLSMVFAVAGALLIAFFRVGRPARLAILLMAPLGVIYWGVDPGTFGRKETLGYLAAVVLMIDRNAPRAFFASAVIYAAAVIGHEVNVFFLPFLLLIGFLRTNDPDRPWIWTTIMISIAFLGMVFALMYVAVDDTGGMCAPLMAHTDSDIFCLGIIAWLDKGFAANPETVGRLMDIAGPMDLAFAFALAAAPLLFAVAASKRKTWMILGCLAAFVVLAPVFYMARDWGRWISMAVLGATFVIMTAALWQPRRAKFLFAPVTTPQIALATFAAIFLSFDHSQLVPFHGLSRIALAW